jgi:hypothetical protein
MNDREFSDIEIFQHSRKEMPLFMTGHKNCLQSDYLLGPGPLLIKKRICRAAVSQRLRNTGLGRHGFGMARHSALSESTASRCCLPDEISPTSCTVRPWRNIHGEQAHTFRRNPWRHVREARRLNPFTSNKHVCQAQNTSPGSSEKRQAEAGSRITLIYTRHSPQPQINKNFKIQYLMLYIKTNQFNVGLFSFLIAFPVRINYDIDQQLLTVSWTCPERCSDLPHAARISKVHCQHTHKGLGRHRLFNTNANQLFRCFHPSDHFQKY